MSIRKNFDPNTNKPFHLFLLALAFGSIWFTSGASFFFCLAMIGWVFARWIVEGAGVLKRRSEEAATEEWNGRHFAYHEHQIRIFWDPKHIWIKAADVYKVLGESPDSIRRKKIAARLGRDGYGVPSRNEGECFSDQGIIVYLSGYRDLATAQFRRWFEREVFLSLNKQRETAADAFERHMLR